MNEKDSYSIFRENKGLRIIFFILFAAVITGLVFIFRYYFWPFLFAVIIYISLRPFNEKVLLFARKRYLSASIVLITMIVLVMVPLFMAIVALGDQTYQLYLLVQDKVASGIIKDILNSQPVSEILLYLNISQAEVFEKLIALSQKTAMSLFASITSIISFPISFMMNIFFMVLMLFFLLKDGHKLDEPFYAILPFPDDIERHVVDRLKEVIRVLLAGNLMIMLLQGTMVGLGLFFTGFEMPLLWGSIAAVLSLIPVVGTTFIWLPGVVYLLFTGNYVGALFLGIWCLFWYLLLENFVKPKVFGEKLNFHPLLFFFLLLGSIQAFNLPGVIVGPILLTLFYSFWEIYKILSEYYPGKSSDVIEDESL